MPKRIARLIAIIAALVGTIGWAGAQSVTISPKNPQIVLGGSAQFHAETTGLSSPDLVWSVEGIVGGNASYGRINAAGLYSAPAIMPPNAPYVSAAAKANSAYSAGTYVLLLTYGPTITRVTPNPIQLGTSTVTVTGSGLVPGATIFVAYNSVGKIALSTTFHSGTSVSGDLWLGPCKQMVVSVKNPGSDFSNGIVVPVGFKLNVVNGSGSGIFTAGAVASIKANPPPDGQAFTKWTGAGVANASLPSTTVTMPAANTTVKANYSGGEKLHTLLVINGTGGGSYNAGAVVTIAANTAPPGQTFLNWTGYTVVNSGAPSTTLVMPAASATVTANYSGVAALYALTVVNGSGGGSYAAGAGVKITANAPPPGQIFKNWTGAATADPNSPSTTITMPAADTLVTANYSGAAVNIPYPVSTHPRLWITVADLPRLQSWASASNPIYQQGLKPLLAQAVSNYQTHFFPNGVQNPNYPDPGDTQGYSGYLTEQTGSILAFNSLIDPDPKARAQYAAMARNIFMVAMKEAVKGHLSGAPFRDPLFAVYNRANGSGEQWPLIVDWIYSAKDSAGQPILSASDKLTIRNVFLIWANDCLNASTTGGDHPAPIGVTNSTQLLPGSKPYRMAANNYYLGHARLLTMMALAIDPADDPAVNGAQPLSQTGNSLRSYILNANGAWLYQEYAMYGEAAQVAADYGIAGGGAGFGIASGGLPPEGMLYGHSYGYLLGQLLALQTAGFNSTAYAGPQIKLIGAPMWDRFVHGYMASLTPAPWVDPTQTWLGPVYMLASYGDLLRLWATPDSMAPFALLHLLEQQNGRNDHHDAARWFAVNAAEGGPAGLYQRVTQPWSYGTTDALLYFLLLDPALAPAPDPRPSFPNTFYDEPAGRIVAHSDWTPNATLFDYRASWISINHQVGDAGQFEMFRRGEWLTKEMSNYDNNALGLTTTYHNTLALQNWCANGKPNLNWYEGGEWANGSQWMLGLNSGDPATITSTGPNYVFAASDLTKLYNRPDFWTPANAALDITRATRSILWLDNDYIVVYDRATSAHTGLFKRFNMCFVTNPVISGHNATQTLPSGQRLYVQTLMPANPMYTVINGAANMNPIAIMEPTRFVMQVEDASKPADTRFLHVLQGADPNVPAAKAVYAVNISGTAFDGAAFGTTAVYFPTAAGGSFSGTQLPAPAGVHTVIVTGLTPNAAYTVTTQPGVITIKPGGAGPKADSAGLIVINL